MSNEIIKQEMKVARVYYHELARELGISEATLYRRMRDEMPSGKKDRILQAIKDLQVKRFKQLRA